MNHTTETQIRAAFVGLDELQGTITVEDILHAAGPVRPVAEVLPQQHERTWSLRPVWVGLVAAGVVAVLIAAPLLWSRSSDAPPATTPSTVPTSVPPATPTTTVAADTEATTFVVPPGPAPSLLDTPSLASAGWVTGLVHGISNPSEEIGPAAVRLVSGDWFAYESGWSDTPLNGADEAAYLYDSTSTEASVKWQGVALPFGDGTWTTDTGNLTRKGNPPYIIYEFHSEDVVAVWSTEDGVDWKRLDFGTIEVGSVWDWYQIGDSVLAYASHGSPQQSDLFVSSDAGATFSRLDHPIVGGSGLFSSIYATDAGFRALVWVLEDGSDRRVPQLWSSDNGTNWTFDGAPEGLPPHVPAADEGGIVFDGVNCRATGGTLEFCKVDAVRSDLLVATIRTVTNDGSAHAWFHSVDGLTWEQSTRFPTELAQVESSTEVISTVIDDWLVLTVSDPNEDVVVSTIISTQDLYRWHSRGFDATVWRIDPRPQSVQWLTVDFSQPMRFTEPTS